MSTDWLKNQSIFGSTNISNNDIDQGFLGDCYFLSGCSAVAEHPRRFNQIILTDFINNAGIFVINGYIRGIPQTIYIDDYIPFRVYDSGNEKPIFAQQADDGALWALLLEKVWAKVAGNYQSTIAGNAFELFEFIGGSPYITY